jgi:hypothetical protein
VRRSAGGRRRGGDGRVTNDAKKGEAVALKLCVERSLPTRAARDRWVQVEGPGDPTSTGDLVAAAASVIERAAVGEITLSGARSQFPITNSGFLNFR